MKESLLSAFIKKVAVVGGEAGYVLIGGAVKQLGEHILASLRVITLESAVRKNLSIIITSPLVRKRRKRVHLKKKT